MGSKASKNLPLSAKSVSKSGAEGDRTPDLAIANGTLYQLSYDPDSESGIVKLGGFFRKKIKRQKLRKNQNQHTA